MSNRRIHAKTILLQYQASLDRGVSAADMAAIGMSAQELQGPDTMVPAHVVYAHLELVAERIPFEPFAIDVATRHKATSLGVLGLAMRSASTRREALARFQRYQHIMNSLATFELLEESGHLIWTEYRWGQASLGHELATEIAVLGAIHIARSMAEDALRPTAVEVRRLHADVAQYEAACGCPVRAGSDRGRIFFEAVSFDEPLATADQDLADYFDEVLRKKSLEAAAQPAYVAEVRRVIASALYQGAPAIQEVAKTLGVSARTLQRRLKDEGTSFADVVEALRRDLAVAYLSNPSLSAAEVAYLLGYTEATSFYRAFRRWHGQPPDAFRSHAG